ncbi:MAG: hypothetical protein KIT16_04210 [Rhodospirillaceae bacterium]|nr:hypothetical protein [Rhodospirillaceae bacterium]
MTMLGFERLPAPVLLEALDGVAYVVGLDGRVIACGSANWRRFADANGAGSLNSRDIAGTELMNWVQGAEVREIYRRFHDALASGRRDRIAFSFRCDAPALRREFWMTIRPIKCESAIQALLYHSLPLAEISRPRVDLFDFAAARRPNTDDDGPRLYICSWCQMVGWPQGQTSTGAEWIEATEYYRRGGKSEVAISHGMCPACFRKAEAELAPPDAA